MRELQETRYQTEWYVNHRGSYANASFICGTRVRDERDRGERVYTDA
jgi:hypothetical protein